MKPPDKAILGMVSKSPGRNVSEPIGGLEKLKPRRLSPYLRAISFRCQVSKVSGVTIEAPYRDVPTVTRLCSLTRGNSFV